MCAENSESRGIAELSGQGPWDDGDVSDTTASYFSFFNFFTGASWMASQETMVSESASLVLLGESR